MSRSDTWPKKAWLALLSAGVRVTGDLVLVAGVVADAGLVSFDRVGAAKPGRVHSPQEGIVVLVP